MTKDFIIIFFGLIAHFGLPNGNPPVERAVLTRYANHTPVLFVRDADVKVPVPVPPPLAPTVCPGGAITGVTCYDLTEVHLEIRDLPPGLPGSVDSHLPRLTNITDGKNAEPQVKKADTTFTHAFAYVDYTGGCLKAPKLNDPEVYWGPPRPPVSNCNPNGPGPNCVPLYTVHDSTPRGDFVILYVDKGPAVNLGTPASMRQITLAANSKIAVVNLSAHIPGPDYKEHLWLNDGRCMLEMHRKVSTPCGEKPDTMSCDHKYDLADLNFTDTLPVAAFVNRYSLEVECGQTQNPPPP
jgi:hypothetical protein